ncbi:MAG: hypothetical protein Q9170_002198 [Blastenia crenularia]
MNGPCGVTSLPLDNRDTSPTHLTQPFSKILDSEGKEIAYTLPHVITRYQSTVRYFRSSLPKSLLPEEEQEYFRDMFTQTIDLSSNLTTNTQRYCTHMAGIINSHVTDTKWVVQRLERQGFLSAPPVAQERALAQVLVQWNSYRLIYLPPTFQQTSVNLRDSRSLGIMEEHVYTMTKRLAKSIDMNVELQRLIFVMLWLADQISGRVARQEEINLLAGFERDQDFMLWVSEKVFGRKTWEGVQLDGQRKWFAEVAPVFYNAAQFLNDIVTQLKAAENAAQALLERLQFEGRAVKWGAQLPDWVYEQAKELDEGIANLQTKMTAFDKQERAFLASIFQVEA